MSGDLNPLTGTGGRLPQLYSRQENYVLLYRGTLTGSFTTLYTAPTGSYPTGADHKTEITDVTVCNTDSNERFFYICIVPNAGTAGVGNSVFWNTSIAAGTSYFMNTGRIIVPNGYTVQGKADTTTLICVGLQGNEIR